MENKVLCPDCGECSWTECETSCDVCGSHSAYRCKKCGFAADLIEDSPLFGAIQMMLEEE